MKESIWFQTYAKDFGYKCVSNRHELCTWEKCKCICHRFEQELSEY